MSSFSFLVTELQSLASETRRKHPEVREAAEKSLTILKGSPEQAIPTLFSDGPQSDDLLRPVFMGCATKNAKVVAISIGSLQRLITLKAVPQSSIPVIISTMNECLSQGVDIQLRILQTLSSLLTNFPSVHGPLLGDALLLCFKLQESRIAVVSSTAAATLRQLVMFVFEKVVEENKTETSERGHDIILPGGSSVALLPSALDAFSVFEDLCLLVNSERPKFLRLDSLPKTFGLELIESVLTNYHGLFRKHNELLLLLQHHLCPLLLKSLSERPLFPLTLRSTRVVFLLLKQFSAELTTEAEVFLMLLVKIIAGETDAIGDGSNRPQWMRVLAMEIIRGLCNDADLMRDVWDRYDAQQGGSQVFTSLITSLKRLVTEKPALLGVGNQMFGVGVQAGSEAPGTGASYGLDVGTVAGMVANAASATVSGVVGMMSTGSGLSLANSTMKLQCIDQLDKADAPAIPDSYIYLLALHCLVSLADGFASTTLPLYNSIILARPRTPGDSNLRAPPALELSNYSADDNTVRSLRTIYSMVESGWPGLLAALSFLISTNLSDELFADVLSSMQNLTKVCGVLGLYTPRDAFFSSLSKFAVPTRVVSRLDSYVEPPPTPRSAGVLSVDIAALAGGVSQPPGLSERNLACLKVLISNALFLAGSLGASWYGVLEALQNADYVLTNKGSRNAPTKRNTLSVSNPPSAPVLRSVSGSTPIPSQPRHPLLSDLDTENILAGMNRLFDASKSLQDDAFKEFVAALCKLSAEMVGMQSGTGVFANLDSTDDSPISPNSDPAHRRRVSGIHLSRTLRTGDFGVAKLGMVSLMNIHRLIYRDPEIAWISVTTHLLAIIRHPLAPAPIRLQSASVLDEILVVIPKNLGSVGELQGKVQRRMLDVLAQQVSADTVAGNTNTVVDIRRMGLETLHQILQTAAHTLILGWETIFEMLGSVCKPPTIPETPLSAGSNFSNSTGPPTPRQRPPPLTSLTDKGSIGLIRIAFQSLTLVCDTLSSLSPQHLRLCISTLGLFGRQADTNIALTAAESLLWGVSDSIQAKRKDADMEPEYSALWMFLLLELLGLCTDARPEVRGGAIQTLFRTLQLYGTTLSLETWDECLWMVVFPLLESITTSIRHEASLASPDASHPSPSSKAWDESKTLALQSVGSIFHDYLGTKIMPLPSFEKAWNSFVEHIQDTFLFDNRVISTAGLRCLEKAIKAAKNTLPDLHSIVSIAAARVWTACDEMGGSIVRWSSQSFSLGRTGPGTLPLTQDTLLAFVDLIRSTHDLNRALTGSEWDLSRLKRLLAILKGVVTYPNSPDYRPDIDALTPVQADVLDAIADIDLTVPGSPSIVLCDLSEYSTLAFVAAFDVGLLVEPHPDTAKPSKRVTYIALCKKTMPHVVKLYLQFKDEAGLYVDGTLEALLSAYSIPVKLKYECPAPSKFGSDPPLWKTATISFLNIAKECAPRIGKFENIPGTRIEGIWRQIVDVFRGGLLSDCSMAESLALDVQETEENFDMALIVTLESDIIPYLGDSRIPDYLITQFAHVLHNASRIVDFEDDQPSAPGLPVNGISTASDAASQRKRPLEFIPGKVEQVMGYTATGSVFPRERFSYWCFDLLFSICSDTAEDHVPARKRVASLSLPSLLSRCQLVLSRYIADAALRGNAPFPRVREAELIYVLKKLLELKVWPGSLWAALSSTPSEYAITQPDIDTSLPLSSMMADLARRSSKAHLFHFISVLSDIASAPHQSPSGFITPSSPVTEASGTKAGPVEVDAKSLARSCLKQISKEMGMSI